MTGIANAQISAHGLSGEAEQTSREPRRRVGIARRLGRVKTLASAVVLTLTAAMFIGVPEAAADTVWAWGNPVLMVTTGGKNYSNHTQWVSSITVEDPGSQVCDGGTYEAWAGSVWYASRVPCSPQYGGTMNATTFYVSRWVPSGSGVCGSFWRWTSRMGWYRWVDCITIRV